MLHRCLRSSTRLLAALLLGSAVQAQCELVKLTDCDAPPFSGAGDTEDFGEDVAVSGNRLVIGNAGANAGVFRIGCALVYERTGRTWFETDVLDPTGAVTGFGKRVDVDGDTIVVSDGLTTVEMFEQVAGTWTTVGSFATSDQFHQLGNDVAVDGPWMVVGAKTNPEGRVKFYEEQAGVWVETQELGPLPNLFNRFGESVALDGTTAVVGAFNEDGPSGESGLGAVYVYDFDGFQWSETVKLQPSATTALGGFGFDVSISGDRIAVGTTASSLGVSSGGVVLTFSRRSGAWIEEHTIHADDVAAADQFGYSVDLVGDRLVVGAPNHDAGAFGNGQGYAFDLTPVSWSQEAGFRPASRGNNDRIGTAVATDGDFAILSSPGDDDQGTDYGAVFVFSASGSTCPSLSAFPDRISLSGGGTVSLQLNATVSEANRRYLVAGSISGTSPGIAYKGELIPLRPDAYFRYTLANANAAELQNTLGFLNGSGRSNAQITIPAGTSMSLAGLKLTHAFLTFEAGFAGPLRHVSNAHSVRLDP